jgi:hypothetical protein
MKMERIECSETSAFKIQTPGNHPEENIQQVFYVWLVDLHTLSAKWRLETWISANKGIRKCFSRHEA